MDLATPDKSYREISLRETQKVIDITRKLKKYLALSKGFHPIVDEFESHSSKIKEGN